MSRPKSPAPGMFGRPAGPPGMFGRPARSGHNGRCPEIDLSTRQDGSRNYGNDVYPRILPAGLSDLPHAGNERPTDSGDPISRNSPSVSTVPTRHPSVGDRTRGRSPVADFQSATPSRSRGIGDGRSCGACRDRSRCVDPCRCGLQLAPSSRVDCRLRRSRLGRLQDRAFPWLSKPARSVVTVFRISEGARNPGKWPSPSRLDDQSFRHACGVEPDVAIAYSSLTESPIG
jgi:hypothetical protein